MATDQRLALSTQASLGFGITILKPEVSEDTTSFGIEMVALLNKYKVPCAVNVIKTSDEPGTNRIENTKLRDYEDTVKL